MRPCLLLQAPGAVTAGGGGGGMGSPSGGGGGGSKACMPRKVHDGCVRLLARVKLFGCLKPEELDAVVAAATVRSYTPGQRIITQVGNGHAVGNGRATLRGNAALGNACLCPQGPSRRKIRVRTS